MLAGLGLSLYALGAWGQADFGGFDPVFAMRIVLPAVTVTVLGLQIILFAFFYSVLRLKQ